VPGVPAVEIAAHKSLIGEDFGFQARHAARAAGAIRRETLYPFGQH
jgi:hypothetical protein